MRNEFRLSVFRLSEREIVCRRPEAITAVPLATLATTEQCPFLDDGSVRQMAIARLASGTVYHLHAPAISLALDAGGIGHDRAPPPSKHEQPLIDHPSI